MNRSRLCVGVLAGAAMLWMAGCDQAGLGVTPIGDITRQSAAFEGKEVTIRGVSSQAIKIPFIEIKFYRLKDATGEMVVQTSGMIPADGEEMIVRGRVENLLVVDGRGMGITLREQERKSAWLKMSAK